MYIYISSIAATSLGQPNHSLLEVDCSTISTKASDSNDDRAVRTSQEKHNPNAKGPFMRVEHPNFLGIPGMRPPT